jgi:hypothetical protein
LAAPSQALRSAEKTREPRRHHVLACRSTAQVAESLSAAKVPMAIFDQ